MKSSLDGNSSINITLPFFIKSKDIASSADIPQFDKDKPIKDRK